MTKFLSSALFLGLSHCALATVGTIAVDNFEGGAFNSINNSADIALTSSNSSFYVGHMDESGIASSNSVADLFTHFTSFGEVRADPDANPVVSPGFLSGDATGDFAPLDTQDVYVFVMNAANAASANEALVWKLTGSVFDDDPSPLSVGPQEINMIAANGTAVFGIDASGNGSYQLQTVSAVPEPSSSALLGLGSVALLLRRRR